MVKQEKIGDDLYEYQYNKLNNITRITKNGKTWKEYRYDNHEELIREDDYERNKTTRYQYDNSGNILAVKEYELNTYNLLKKDAYEYTNNSWKDQLTKYNADSITYDTIGNPLTIGNNISLGWINGRQLDTYVDTIKNISASYQYNKDGIRIKKTVNNTPTEYYVENNQIIFETRNNDMLYYIRDNIGNLIALLHNNNLYYYLLNIQGDVVGLLDENYNLVASYKYDSFGKIIAIEDGSQNDISNNPTHIANINPFRYRSYYYDNETELYYLNSRYYSPEIGRFINADGVINANNDLISYNLYTYVSNNFINKTDSSGEVAIAGTIIAGTLQAFLAQLAIGVIAVGTIMLIGGLIGSVAESIPKTNTKPKKEKKKEDDDERIHNVYLLKEPSGKVIYVGRTKDLERREKQHERNPYRAHLTFVPDKRNLTRDEARGVEQALIIKHKTLNRSNKAANQINGVRWDQQRYYIKLALPYLDPDEREIFVGW